MMRSIFCASPGSRKGERYARTASTKGSSRKSKRCVYASSTACANSDEVELGLGLGLRLQLGLGVGLGLSRSRVRVGVTCTNSDDSSCPTTEWCPFNWYRSSGDINSGAQSWLSNLQTTIRFQDWEKPLSVPGCWAYPDM